ncbi:endosomal peripheral membrane protein [Pelomyxa schiedti]|nr:endosomal peripheral membrane protein [Pelomyxa schiedti]
MRVLEKLPHERFTDEMAKCDEIVLVITGSFETRNMKLVSIAVSLTQKLFSACAVSQHNTGVFLKLFGTLTDHSSEELQVKVLQALTTLISTDKQLHGTLLAQALEISFTLHARGGQSVRSTASATLPMVIGLLFDRAVGEYTKSKGAAQIPQQAQSQPNHQQTQDTTHQHLPQPTSAAAPQRSSSRILASFQPCIKDAYLLVQDICSLSAGDPPSFLLFNQLTPTFGFELLEIILQRSQMFTEIPEFRQLLPDRVCPLLISSFMHLGTDFQFSVRLMRVICMFVTQFSSIWVTETEVLVIRLLKILDLMETVDWVRVLIFETFRIFLMDKKLVCSIFSIFDMRGTGYTSLLHDVVNGVGKFIRNPQLVWPEVHIAEAMASKFKCLDAHSLTSPPLIKGGYVVCVSLSCILALGSTLNDIARNITPTDSKFATLATLANDMWPIALSSLTLVLDKNEEEIVSQVIFKAFEGLVFSMGSFHLNTPRDAFLTALCKNALPEVQDQGMLTTKNVMSVKTLLNIAHCMGNILEGGWGIVLKTFEQIHLLFSVTEKSTLEDMNNPNDLTVIRSALSSLWDSTVNLDTHSLQQLLQQLVRLSKQTLKSGTSLTDSSDITVGITNYSLARLMDTALLNVKRIEHFWGTIKTHLIEAARYKIEFARLWQDRYHEDLKLRTPSPSSTTETTPLVTGAAVSASCSSCTACSSCGVCTACSGCSTGGACSGCSGAAGDSGSGGGGSSCSGCGGGGCGGCGG